jgi:hypothetical protein
MKKLLAAAGITAGLLLVGGVAVASIPGPTGVINGCRSNSTGLVYVIDSSATCGFNMTPLPWNQTGAQGAPGVTGPAGPSGTAALHIVTIPGTVATGTPRTETTASCPSGEKLISFSGYTTFPGGGGYPPGTILKSAIGFHTHDLTSARWYVENPSGTFTQDNEVQLTCAA